MNKKYIFGFVLFGLMIAGITYFFLASSSETKKLEINFIADHAICESGSNLPAELSLFSSVFEITEQSINFYPEIRFKRLDIDAPIHVITYSKNIDEETDLEEANQLYGDETPLIKAPTSMFTTENKLSEMKSLEQDTLNTLFFYLLPKGDINVDNKFIFDNPSTLKKQITHRMEKNELFAKGQKENQITVLILNQLPEKNEVKKEQKKDEKSTINPKTQNEPSKVVVPIEKPIVKPVIVPNPKPTVKPKKYDAKIQTNGNAISWNSELKTADKLTIKFTSKVNGKVLVQEDVTGQSDFHFSYRNSIYEESAIKIELFGVWSNGSSVTNNTKTVSDLECH